MGYDSSQIGELSDKRVMRSLVGVHIVCQSEVEDWVPVEAPQVQNMQ